MKKALFTIGLSLFISTSYAIYDPAMEMPVSKTPTPMLMNARANDVSVPIKVKYNREADQKSTGGGMKEVHAAVNGTDHECSCGIRNGHRPISWGPSVENFDGPMWLFGLAKLGYIIFSLFMLGVVVFVVRKSWDLGGCKKK